MSTVRSDEPLAPDWRSQPVSVLLWPCGATNWLYQTPAPTTLTGLL